MHRDELLASLAELVRGLYEETHGFLERTDELQAWYNRGYANGVIEVLREREPEVDLGALGAPDLGDVIAGHEWLPWGRAYRHGLEKGRGEALEVLEKNPGA